jgi:copper transport protein
LRCGLLFATIAALILEVGAAFGHASLVSSEPGDGAVLGAAPSRFVLTFNEPVAPLVLRLIDSSGSSTTLDAFQRHGNAIVIEAPREMLPGSHALSWRVTSADGHPIGGSVLFSIGAANSTVIPEGAASIDRSLRTAIWFLRVALYLGLFVGIGGVFFNAFVASAPVPPVRMQARVLVAALVAAPVSVGLQGLDALALPLSDFVQPHVWQAAISTSYGTTVLIAFVALAAALASLAIRAKPVARLLAAGSLAGAGLALAASGHASNAAPQIVMRPAVFVHATAIAFWVGSLLPLGSILRARGSGADFALARFSKSIPFVVAALVGSGIALAVVQVRNAAALWGSDYGRVLLVKLALLVVLFGLAAFNRWRLTAPAKAGEPRARRRLVTVIAIDIGVGVVILGTVALWRFTPPPRALEAASSASISLHLHSAEAMAILKIAPGRPGPVSVLISVSDGNLAPLQAKDVELSLSNAGAGIEPIRREATREEAGTWRVDGLVVPAPGTWSARLGILIGEFDKIVLEGEFDVPER